MGRAPGLGPFNLATQHRFSGSVFRQAALGRIRSDPGVELLLGGNVRAMVLQIPDNELLKGTARA